MDRKTLVGSVFRRLSAAGPVVAVPAVVLVSAVSLGTAFQGPEVQIPRSDLARLQERAVAVSAGLEDLQAAYQRDVAPVEQMLRPFHDDERWVRRVSLALVREARDVGLDPRVLASVLLVENPWLEPGARSGQGAVGLMQVMPLHAGRWGCPSADLTDVESNICHGARIFAHDLRRAHGDLDRALLAYNGCVSGTNTPNCHTYPGQVYARAGRAALERWLILD